jgi:DNA-binding transcriptional MerR regulator
MNIDSKTTMSQTAYLKIGELAKQTGVAVGTLRYYSDLGLLIPIHRGDNGYRYYSQDASQQVQFIKKAQAIGFTLEEIKQILDVRDRGEKPCSLVQNLLDNKIEQLEIQIKKMSLFKQELEEYRTSWINHPNLESNSQEVCPLISTVVLDSKRQLTSN